MSFSRLRRSNRYPIVIDIYKQVQDKPFFGRQVGIQHPTIGKLKNHGDIIPLSSTKYRIKNTTKNSSYEVKIYKLSIHSIDCIRADVESGKIDLTEPLNNLDTEPLSPEDAQETINAYYAQVNHLEELNVSEST